MSLSLHTSHGDLKIQLFYKETPKAAENFLAQCAQDTYNGVKARRSEPGFILQFPQKSKSINDAELETLPTITHQRGTVSVAKQGNNSFYIAYGRQPELDHKHTVFGRIINGLDVLDRLEQGVIEKKEVVAEGKAVQIVDVTIHVNPFALSQDSTLT